MNVVKCARCGRKLTSTKSVARGYGEQCAKLAKRQAIVDTFKDTQVAKAQEVLDLNAYQRLGKITFAVLSSDGNSMYTATDDVCSCEAGKYGKHVCYHRISVMLLTA